MPLPTRTAEYVSLRYLLCLLPTVLVVAGNLLGHGWACLNLVFSLVGLVAADWLVPVNRHNNPTVPARLPNAVLVLAVLAHTAGIATLLWGVAAGVLRGGPLWAAVASTGLNAGILGVTAAHELIHRRQVGWRALGRWNLLLVNYLHFYVEHRLGHHRHVGTAADPATARYGEGFWAFLLRTVPGQFRSAVAIENDRLRRRRPRRPWLHHAVWQGVALQVVVAAGLGLALGGLVMVAYLAQSAVAILLLEFVNYIEHYGLVRAEGEVVGPHHAWQSDTVSSRFMLFELSRHADHHAHAHKPYHTLNSLDEGYRLPSGYFGLFYVGLIPPLWRRVVHPRLHRAARPEA